MSNNKVDPFGLGGVPDVGTDIESALAEYESEGSGAGGVGSEDAQDAGASTQAAAKKPLPKSLLIGMAVAGVFVLIVIVVAISSVSSRMRQNSARADEAQRLANAQQEQLKASEMGASQLALQEQVKSMQEAIRQQRDQLSKVSGGSLELSAVQSRLDKVEQGLALTQQQLQDARKRAADDRPFEAEMYIREDARIVSIGNGIARVRMASGDEVTVRRGDKWNGLRVMAIRADRAQVTLSDGSVIL